MNSKIKRLEKKIKKLESKVETLEDQCGDLRDRLHRMAISKISDPRYTYWNWQLSRPVPEETVRELNHLLSSLSHRVKGTEIDDMFKKSIPGISSEWLYASGPLKVEDVFAAIKTITGMTGHMQVVDLIRAVEEQGFYSELCEYVLTSPSVAVHEEHDGR